MGIRPYEGGGDSFFKWKTEYFDFLHAGIGGEAAVNGKGHAGDEGGGLVVQQEQHRAGELLLGIAEAAHRSGGQELAGAGVLLLGGLLVALFPSLFAKVLFSALGVLIVLSGLGDIERSRRMVADDDQVERMTLRVGLVTVAVGIGVTVMPSLALRVVPLVCGVALVVDGLSELYLALTMGN